MPKSPRYEVYVSPSAAKELLVPKFVWSLNVMVEPLLVISTELISYVPVSPITSTQVPAHTPLREWPASKAVTLSLIV